MTILPINPIGKPRQTQRDKWMKRKPVIKYRNWSNALKLLFNKKRIELGQQIFVIYMIEMPRSWNDKKKDLFQFREHLVKPDTDNITKGYKDTLAKSDSFVFKECAAKYYDTEGCIIVCDNLLEWVEEIARIERQRAFKDENIKKMPKYLTDYLARK